MKAVNKQLKHSVKSEGRRNMETHPTYSIVVGRVQQNPIISLTLTQLYTK